MFRSFRPRYGTMYCGVAMHYIRTHLCSTATHTSNMVTEYATLAAQYDNAAGKQNIIFCRCAHAFPMMKMEKKTLHEMGSHKQPDVRSTFGCDACAVYVCCRHCCSAVDVDMDGGEMWYEGACDPVRCIQFPRDSMWVRRMALGKCVQTNTYELPAYIHIFYIPLLNPCKWMMRTWTFGRLWSIRMKHVQLALHAIASVRVLRCSSSNVLHSALTICRLCNMPIRPRW